LRKLKHCTLQLGYSGSSAQRRIKTARCIREFPEIFSMLERNEIGLSGVCMLADILTTENKSELVKEARCKSKRRIEQIVARFKPGRDIIEKVKPVFVSTFINQSANTCDGDSRTTKNTKAPGPCSALNNTSRINFEKSTAAGGSRNPADCSGTSKQTPILRKKYKLEFAVDPECMKKIEEAKTLLSRKHPEGVPLGLLLEEALDAYLDKHSPERKKRRRENRRKKREGHAKPPTNRDKNDCNKSTPSRHIPQAIQDEVFARDKGRCTYVGRDGKRCGSTWNLHIDHIKPYARGGEHSTDNLRLRCAAHNQLEAEITYSKEFMDEKRRKSIPLIL